MHAAELLANTMWSESLQPHDKIDVGVPATNTQTLFWRDVQVDDPFIMYLLCGTRHMLCALRELEWADAGWRPKAPSPKPTARRSATSSPPS